MKKLTKRVQAGGLWFDVPVWTKWICILKGGKAVALDYEPEILSDGSGYIFDGYYAEIGLVNLDGADWRDCCWYVGDQTDGEDSERREWMARGVCLLGQELANRIERGEDDACLSFSRSTAIGFAAKILAGEVY